MTINTTKIEGYAEMTPEQKVSALEAYDFTAPEPDYTGYIKKETFDKTASELARLKKEAYDRMDEDTRSKAELAELKERNAELEKNVLISEYRSKYLAKGYDEALANETAKALADGDLNTVFANDAKFIEAHDKQIKASLLGKNSTPPAGGGNALTKEQIMKIKDYDERQNAIAENIELFVQS